MLLLTFGIRFYTTELYTVIQAAITSPLIVNRLTMDQSIISQSVDQSTFERIFQLEDMKLNMSQSSRKDLQNNVNVTSCNVGSITLFVLDQQTGHYVAYLTSSNNKHFLHVDSLEGLGLSSTEVWIVAEVTEREQCQVKKSNNRFMLPVGTRFYRVKAKPWNPDTCKKTGGQKS
ncbi:hypothetical protein HELRODRAFT_168407 [Helobdella robusta]|uniref:Autophagy-related protein 11 C-terminal domain-containing protein n=1 Tax=Helobdella robusta TaxID=6412 RepID=T1F0K1_HELRO|nr:hypothetical protein HELRODRAFT_168407 [Helobdella robusta]ESO09423.1 hypothetical protein HELRODRAFT_168407 [Helobdella robusta]